MHNLEIMVLQMSNRERHFSRNMKLSRILAGSSLIPNVDLLADTKTVIASEAKQSIFSPAA
jgi:hypothetical protein